MDLEDYIVAPTPKGGKISEEAMIFAKPNNPVLNYIGLACLFGLPAMVFLDNTSTFVYKILLYLGIISPILLILWVAGPQHRYPVYFSLDKKGLHFYSDLTNAILPKNLNLDVHIGHKIGDSDIYFTWQEKVIPLHNISEFKFEESLNQQFGNNVIIITVVRKIENIFAKNKDQTEEVIYLALDGIQRDQLNWIIEAGNVMLSFLNGKRLEKPEESIPVDEINLDSDISPNDDTPAGKPQNA